MVYVLCVIAGLVVGGCIAWLISSSLVRKELRQQIEDATHRAQSAEGQAAERAGTAAELRSQHLKASEEAEKLQGRLEAEQVARAKAETQLRELSQRLEEERRLLDEAKTKLLEAFKAAATDTLNSSNAEFLKLANETFGKLVIEAKGDLGQRQEAIQGLVKPLADTLKLFNEHVQAVEKNRHEAYAGLTEQVKTLNSSHQLLQKETGNLVTALRTPKVVGCWGEVALKRVVELAGMSEHSDFSTEVSVTTEDGRLRPDLVVHLPGGSEIVVDAKATFGAYQEAVAADSEEKRTIALARHAAQIRAHMEGLASKTYWEQFDTKADFVVMFIPGESFFAAALDVDRQLLEDAMAKRVILATPTTLIALLRAVAYGWHQEQVAENAQKISDLGKDLHKRMAKLVEYIADIGKHLDRATQSYNSSVSSLESRVIPAARKFKELGATSDDDIPTLEPVQTAQRTMPALEDTKELPAAGSAEGEGST